MSRTKNRYEKHMKNNRKIYRVGIYTRISVDNKNNSIENQIELAKEYIKNKKDMMLVGIYIDRAKSGNDFHRKGFDNLMKDIDEDKVNCIIVKDVSRLGRNFIELSKIIEYELVIKKVRLIAINENYDSRNRNQSIKNIILHNMINEIYIKDTSFKIRKSKEYLKSRGAYLGVYSPYGYKVEKIDGIRKLAKDYKTYSIVEKICILYREKQNYTYIRNWLYKNSINTKSEYRKSGEVYIRDKTKLKKWSIKSIKETIDNENNYICKGIDYQPKR